jgi:hypothetical protein
MYILLFALLMAAPATAHVGDRIYPIPEISDADLQQFDLHDNSLEDWRRVLLQPSLWAADFFADPTVGDGAPYDPFDMDYRFSISIPDFDTKPSAYRAFHSLSGNLIPWRYANHFYDARLIPAEETAVESDSWGRIKGSFADRE